MDDFLKTKANVNVLIFCRQKSVHVYFTIGIKSIRLNYRDGDA
jgi:hypothetical protein